MTITLNLQKDTFLRDLETLKAIFSYTIEVVDKLRSHYEPLNISSTAWNPQQNIEIQVTPEEFALIGVFNKGV
jgi:hypothetical protein